MATSTGHTASPVPATPLLTLWFGLLAASTVLATARKPAASPVTSHRNDTALFSIDWLDRLDVGSVTRHLHDALRDLGANLVLQDSHERAPVLRALHETLQPLVTGDASPLSPDAYNRTRVDKLLARLCVPLGCGGRDIANDDPGMRAQLFARVIRHVLWPAGTAQDHHSLSATLGEALQTLLASGHTSHPLTCPATAGKSPPPPRPFVAQPWLPYRRPRAVQGSRADAGMPGATQADLPARCPSRAMPPAPHPPSRESVEHALLDSVFSGAQQQALDTARAWTARVLTAQIDPVMARRDVRGLSFGSLPWALLRMGHALLGDEAWHWSPSALTALAIATCPPLDDDAANHAFYTHMLPIVMTHALAHQVVDDAPLRGRDPETLASAIQFFRWRMQQEAGKVHALTHIETIMPTRRGVAEAALRGAGIAPTLTVPSKPRTGFIATHQMHGREVALPTCMPTTGPHALVDVLMSDCLEDLPFNHIGRQRLRAANVTTQSVNRAFFAAFDAAPATLARTHLAPVLQQRIDALGHDERKRWRCDAWTLSRIGADIVTATPPRPQSGTIGVAPVARRQTLHYNAVGTVVITLRAAAANDASTVHHYRVTLAPLGVKRINGSLSDWVDAQLHTLFATDIPEHQLLHRYPGSEITLDSVHLCDCPAGVSAVQAASEALATPARSVFDAAYAVTPSEAQRRAHREAMLDLLPGHRCLREWRANDPQAAIDCTIDLVMLMPLAHAGIGVARTADHLVAELAQSDLARWAARIAQDGLHAVLQPGSAKLAALLDQASHQSLSLSVEAALLFDPGFYGAYRFGALARAHSAAWLDRLAGLPVLQTHLPTLRRYWRISRKFAMRANVWQFRPSSRAMVHRRSPDLTLRNVGTTAKVVMRHTADGWRLASPLSGKSFGPRLTPLPEGQWAVIPARRDIALHYNDAFPLPDELPPVSRSDCLITPARHTRRTTPDASQSLFGACAQLSDLAGSGYARRLSHTRSRPPLWQFDAATQDFRVVEWEDRAVGTAVVDDFSDTQAPLEREYFPFGDQVRWRHLDGNSRAAPDFLDSGTHVAPLQLPAVMIGQFADDTRYVSTSVKFRTEGNVERQLYFVAPYGTFVSATGEHLAMLHVHDRPYTISVREGWQQAPQQRQTVMLSAATQSERELFKQYQTIRQMLDPKGLKMRHGQLMAWSLAEGTMLQQIRVAQALSHMRVTLEDARLVLHEPRFRRRVHSLWRRFGVSLPNDRQIVQRVLSDALASMSEGLPELIRQRGDAIGFAAFHNDEAMAMAAINGVRHMIPVKFVYSPAILLSIDRFEEFDCENLMAALLHEYFHARVGALDLLPGNPQMPAYGTLCNNVQQLKPMLIGARSVEVSLLARHASTLEHLTIMMSYMPHLQKYERIAAFVEGKSSDYERIYTRWLASPIGDVPHSASAGTLPTSVGDQSINAPVAS